MTWEKLSRNYSNGDIIEYEVCYKDEIFTLLPCRSNKKVEGANTTMAVLTGLNEATTYYIRVRASNVNGFGKLGIVMSNTTLEDGKCI